MLGGQLSRLPIQLGLVRSWPFFVDDAWIGVDLGDSIEKAVVLQYCHDEKRIGTWKENPILPLEPYERAVASFLAKLIDDKVSVYYRQSREIDFFMKSHLIDVGLATKNGCQLRRGPSTKIATGVATGIVAILLAGKPRPGPFFLGHVAKRTRHDRKRRATCEKATGLPRR
ncbi:hypothetical protein Scep_019691 [Stephania cephalantha]|uniref:Uncharacterized protein n=1 Tax=Stephania cephalantha TaxID=152367 RepID=A0AAP0IBS4_9MAGN